MKHKRIFIMDPEVEALARRARNDAPEDPVVPGGRDAIDQLMRAFTEFKAANDENLMKRDALLEGKINKINKELDRFEPLNQQLILAEKRAKAMQEQVDKCEAILNRPDLGGTAGGGDARQRENAAYRAAFDRVIRRHPQDRDPRDMELIRQRMNALVTGDDAGAGYLLAPPDMQADILKSVLEISNFRALATVRTIGVGSYKRPKKTGRGTATRVGETQHRTNTGDPAYGMIEIHAPEVFARIEVSQQMLEDAAYDLLAELREDASEQFAYKEGYEHINGAGAANQAEGILTNSEIAYTASGTSAAVTADGMIDLFYGLKTAYTRNANWIFNRATLAAIRKLKDDNKQYLWTPGIAGSVPNTILGATYVEMPDMPNIAADAYPVVFGDFRRAYVIVDRVAISFQVDYVTGADDGLIIFRARRRTGGGVMLPEAVRKLKCSAS